jgi:hypothetical protein
MKPHGRLADAYGRYAAIITAQLEAVEKGDDGTFAELAGQRDALATAIELHDDVMGDAEAAEVRRQIEACLQADLRLRDRLDRIHAESLSATRQIDRNRAAIRSYAQPDAHGGRLDLSL